MPDGAAAGLRGVTLVLGGARSGKSAFGERLVGESGLEAVYIATGRAWDDEMRSRIEAHRTRRGGQWITVEEPVDLDGALVREARPGRAVLVDCLTLWVTNLIMADLDVKIRIAALCGTLRAAAAPIVLVSNEVGLGVVPDNALARDFRDHAGRLHQEIAALADSVYFVAAGLPMKMKG